MPRQEPEEDITVEVPGQYLLAGAAKSSKKQKDSWGAMVAGTSSDEDQPGAATASSEGVAATAPSGLWRRPPHLPGPAATSLPGQSGAEDAEDDFVPSQESISGTRQKRFAQVTQVPPIYLSQAHSVSLTGT